MKWICIAPHLDDVIYSCGGWLWTAQQTGAEVSVWTICAGDPPQGSLSGFAQSLHDRWDQGESPMVVRRREDQAACQELGASWRHWDIPDCIYRTHPMTGQALYTSEEAIFGDWDSAEQRLLMDLLEGLIGEIEKERGEVTLLFPIGVGHHVDHQMVHKLGLLMAVLTKIPVRFYLEYPYADDGIVYSEILKAHGWKDQQMRISEEGVRMWTNAARRYQSQVSTFWPDDNALQEAFREYALTENSQLIWRTEILHNFNN